MQSILESMPQLAAYQPAFLALILLVVAVLVQAFLTGALALGPGHQTAGMPLRGDKSEFSFRVMRTYANSVENLPAFIATLALAIIFGVSPMIVNWLVMLHVAARLAFWAVYYGGIGDPGFGPRTITFVIGLFLNLILAGFTAWAIIM